MLKIHKGDQVMVISGKDKGKTGHVLQVFTRQGRAVVENVNLVKKAQRKTQKNPQGGIIDIEAPIHVSNIMLIDKKTNQPTRFSNTILKDGGKVRLSKKSQEVI